MKLDKKIFIQDIITISAILLVSYIVFRKHDMLEMIVEFSSNYENFELDEIVSVLIVCAFCLVWFSIRRMREMNAARKDVENKNADLQLAMAEIKQLKGILPFCSFCKKIRDDSGYWEQLEIYIKKHSSAEISHGICPECAKKHYPEFFKLENSKHKN